MNIEFIGDEPELDDVQAIPNLQQQAHFDALSGNSLRNCADNLLASLFYLELKEEPEFDGTSWVCRGIIRCRLSPFQKGLRALAERLRETHAQFYVGFQNYIPCLKDQNYRDIEFGKPFSLPVSFKVHSLQDFVDIKLERITRRARSISNCPYKISTLLSDQGLDQFFGYSGAKRPFRDELDSGPIMKKARFSK